MLKKAVFLFFVFAIVRSEFDEVAYYDNLIQSEIKRYSTFKMPAEASQYRTSNTEPIHFGTFDFVIAGSGTAGSVIACRLSEIRDWKILVLEAGPPGNNFTNIPAMKGNLFVSEYNWGYTTTNQKRCCQSSNGNCRYARGKGLGGSSTTNGVVYSRGTRYDFDKWGSQGNPGWFYEDVLPYFKKSENSDIFGNNEYHATGGYLNIEYHRPVSEQTITFLEANEELGIPAGDYNAYEDTLVTGLVQSTTRKGVRESTENAFLDRAKDRKNLEILTGSYVTKVEISESSKKATGVVFSHENILFQATATKEVILSGGVFGSAFILLHSGVGPAEQLKKFNIPVMADLPVGERMNDQAALPLFFETTPTEPEFDLKTQVIQYLAGGGPLAASVDAFSFHKLHNDTHASPDLEISFILNMKINTNEWETNVTDTSCVFEIYLSLLHPKFTGKLYLKSNDPFDYPVIDTNCLGDDDDIVDMLKSIERMGQILETDAFKTLNPKNIINRHCKEHPYKSKEYWLCVMYRGTSASSNAIGTCRMGPKSSKEAVVDHRLKVYGIENLRVADTSIIPLVLAGHPVAASVMIGERVSDFIKEDYKKLS